MLCRDCVRGAAVLQWNLAPPDFCILLVPIPCLCPPCLRCPTIQHPSRAAWCGEAPESGNVVQCNVVAIETATIQWRDKLVLVLSMTLRAGQAMGSRQAAKCGEKKRPCMCPWGQ